MAEKNKLAQIPSQQMPERPTNFLSRMADEAIGAFERYGRRSGAQRDASLALLNQAVDPNTDPLTGAGQKLLGLAGLVTHPLAFFPTGDEWRERLANAGNTSRLGQSIGGMLGDLPSVVDPHLLAGGGALAMAPLAAKVMNKADDVADAGIIAYHGSPHSFDKFDMSKIGTGEGAQAYGHGLYFAEAEDVAKNYRDQLSDLNAPANRGAQNWVRMEGGENEAIAAIERMVSDPQSKAYNDPRMLAIVERIKSGKYKSDNSGSMYQVKLNVKPDELLDWDLPLSEQPKAVQDALTDMKPDWTGGQVHESSRLVPGEFTDKAKATEALKTRGFKGIRYKDAGSRGTDGGTYNYVIFDDNLVSILKKYGIPMTAGAGGAMMVAGQDMPPEFAAQIGGT